MSDENYIPQPGTPLTGPGIEIVVEAVKRRQKNYPDEPLEMTLVLVLLNIGSRFTPLECTGKEWRGFKKDVTNGEGLPTCPDGHPLMQGQGITLGWVLESE